ncbi:hypothetical protein Trydic_g14298 [Trypoxylus dichotomus]
MSFIISKFQNGNFVFNINKESFIGDDSSNPFQSESRPDLVFSSSAAIPSSPPRSGLDTIPRRKVQLTEMTLYKTTLCSNQRRHSHLKRAVEMEKEERCGGRDVEELIGAGRRFAKLAPNKDKMAMDERVDVYEEEFG